MYNRLMLYQNMVKSDEKRLGKIVIESQRNQEGDNWNRQTERIASSIGIVIERAEKRTKVEWKKKVKRKIEESIQQEIIVKEKQFRKMRHQRGQEFGKKSYLMKMGIEEASTTMRRRLEMMDVGNNMGKNRKCKICVQKETTEHMIECRTINDRNEKIRVEWLRETKDIKIIRKVNDWIKQEIEKTMESE